MVPSLRLLLTRPAEDSERIVGMLPEYEAIIAPVLRIEPVDHDSEKLMHAPGLVFTSAHAIPASGPGNGRLAICVGVRTGSVARDAGFDVQQGSGTADSLLGLIAAASVPLLHPHGRHIARRLPVEGMIVYDQLAHPLNDAARAWLADRESLVLPVFSARSARILSAELRDATAPVILVALSDQVAEAFEAPVSEQFIAKTPDICCMLDMLREIAMRK